MALSIDMENPEMLSGDLDLSQMGFKALLCFVGICMTMLDGKSIVNGSEYVFGWM